MLRSTWSLVVVTVVLAVSSTSWASPVSSATPIFEGGGWRISTGNLGTNSVTVVQDEGNSNVLVIELFKYFNQPASQSGQMPSILLTFEQIAPDAQTASKIVINDEYIHNGTGVTWTDFHWILGQYGCASFNQAETYPATHAGFSTDPFNSHEWVQSNEGQELRIFGGTLANGDGFNPGYTGALVIDANLDGNVGAFTLKEIPTVPEPVTMSLLILGGLHVAIRRRY